MLRYGQMMNGYAMEAGLPQRAIASLPVLTPRLASHWVNLVTPIPKSIARPLVESLQNDCVVKDRAIDDLVPRPEGGLMPYREAVRRALGRVNDDAIETSWQDAEVSGAPSDPLPSDPEWAGRLVYTDIRTMTTKASAAQLWSVIEGIGGENGWYSSPLLWAIRGWMDRLVGGVGLARGRRSRSVVTVGDALDFWRVEAIEPGHLLRLRAEMKVPGGAWLELRATPEGDGARFDQRALFFPTGLAGRLYWLSVLPFHGLIFSGMARRITAAAEHVQREDLAPKAKAGRIAPRSPRSRRPRLPRPRTIASRDRAHAIDRARRLSRVPHHARVLTVSDRSAAGLREDRGGPLAVSLLREAGFDCADAVVVADGADSVATALRALIAEGRGSSSRPAARASPPPTARPRARRACSTARSPASPRNCGAAGSPTPRWPSSRADSRHRRPGHPDRQPSRVDPCRGIRDRRHRRARPHVLDQLSGGDHA